MQTKDTKKYWLNKDVKLEILKDGKKLFFTAHILDYDDVLITFFDRDGVPYSFSSSLVQQIWEVSK